MFWSLLSCLQMQLQESKVLCHCRSGLQIRAAVLLRLTSRPMCVVPNTTLSLHTRWPWVQQTIQFTPMTCAKLTKLCTSFEVSYCLSNVFAMTHISTSMLLTDEHTTCWSASNVQLGVCHALPTRRQLEASAACAMLVTILAIFLSDGHICARLEGAAVQPSHVAHECMKLVELSTPSANFRQIVRVNVLEFMFQQTKWLNNRQSSTSTLLMACRSPQGSVVCEVLEWQRVGVSVH